MSDAYILMQDLEPLILIAAGFLGVGVYFLLAHVLWLLVKAMWKPFIYIGGGLLIMAFAFYGAAAFWEVNNGQIMETMNVGSTILGSL